MTLPSATLAIPIALALVGAGLGGAVLTGQLPLATKAQSPAPAGWEPLEVFEGAVSPEATTGSLDLRTFTGPIQLVGWDDMSYQVGVFQKASSGQKVGDGSIEIQFTEDQSDGLQLALAVVPRGNADLTLNGRGGALAVVAFVPSALVYESVLACSGSSHGFLQVLGVLDQVFGDDDREKNACVESDPQLRGSLNLVGQRGSSEDVADIPFSIEDLRGEELAVASDYGDIALLGLDFATATVMTHYGDITGNLDARALDAMTQYGDIGLTAAVDELAAMTQYGDVVVSVRGGASGAYAVHSQYGDVLLGVPSDPARGYDAVAKTQYGEATIELTDAVLADEEEDDGAARAGAGPLGALGLPLGKQGPDKMEKGSVAKAKTEGFDARAVQVSIEALTQYGDVLVTDGELPEAEEDEDQKA